MNNSSNSRAAINFDDLPEIDFVPQLSIDEITTAALAWLSQEENIILQGPEDPSYRVVRSLAYRENIWRKDANTACKSLSLAYSTGDALDHIGNTYHRTPRLEGESHDDYRERLALAPEGTSVAGPSGSYEFHARSASADVKDADAEGPVIQIVDNRPVVINGIPEGTVMVTVLSRTGNGAPSDALLETVRTALNDEWVRPMCDTPIVQAAHIIEYEINAKLIVNELLGSEAIVEEAKQKTQAHVDYEHRLKGAVYLSALDSALHRAGVIKVELENWQDIEAQRNEAPYCTAINITVEVA